ncbi:hypothetical protein V5O48_007351 [Marasmius crinis-equi]|uniref:Beta-lactamase-related domain-containing protein n=1 Tax=Marasmius crinis-equi TaxID=585013 RepID=A0ABR3FGV6_9AGAR
MSLAIRALLALLPFAQLAQNPFETFPSSYNQTNQILTPEIDGFIEGILSSWNSPGGVGVAVVKLEEPEGRWRVETKGYGIANLKEGKPITEDTLFSIASNSKATTGLLISNKSLPTPITWNTKIKSIMPDLWELQDPIATSETTIIDAMSHRTGLPRHDIMYTRNDTTESLLKRLRGLKPSAGFRETWQYNNNMYALLAHLPTVLHPARPSIARYVKEHIFDPLGLDSTTYSLRVARESGNLADPLAREGVNKSEDIFGKGRPRVMRFFTWFLDEGEEGNYISGPGGVIMNAKDAATWLQVLLLEGKNPRTGEQVIPSDAIRKIASGVSVQTGVPTFPELSPVVYGGGQSRFMYRGYGQLLSCQLRELVIITNSSSLLRYNVDLIEAQRSPARRQGARTQMTRLPDAKLGLAVFTNDDNFGTNLMEIIKYRIIDAALGLPAIDWESRHKDEIRNFYEVVSSRRLPRPADPAPPPASFEELAGRYYNVGYDGIELCFVNNSKQSASCQEIIGELPTVLPGAVNFGVPTLIAKWDKFRTTHLKLEHFDGPLFNATMLESQLTGDEDDPYRTGEARTSDSALSFPTAEFVVEKSGIHGVGFFGGFWGIGPEVTNIVEGRSREAAEAFFDRL